MFMLQFLEMMYMLHVTLGKKNQVSVFFFPFLIIFLIIHMHQNCTILILNLIIS